MRAKSVGAALLLTAAVCYSHDDLQPFGTVLGSDAVQNDPVAVAEAATGNIVFDCEARANNVENWGNAKCQEKCQDAESCHYMCRQMCAKCACTALRAACSDYQDADGNKGVLDCTGCGSCKDSLEDHQWCKLKQEGKGSCRSFDNPNALGQNTEEYDYGDTRKVATKAGMLRYKHQPNNEAILAFKRTVCTENTNGNRICDVFKTFQCRKCTTSPGQRRRRRFSYIDEQCTRENDGGYHNKDAWFQCPSPFVMFNSDDEFKGTSIYLAEFQEFVQDCVQGSSPESCSNATLETSAFKAIIGNF